MSRKAFALWIAAILVIGALALLVLYSALNQARQGTSTRPSDSPAAQGP